MTATAPREPEEHLRFYRGIVLVGSTLLPVFGLIEFGVGYNPLSARLIFAAAGYATVLASYASPALRSRFRAVPFAYCCALFAWYSYIASVHDWMMADVIGLLPITIGATVVARRGWEVAAFLLFVVVVVIVAYALTPAPSLDVSVPLGILGVFTLILGWMGVWRSRLEGALRVANEGLEERVRERTASLEREVAERVAAESRANAANAAKSRFLANMSHELRTPLNAVIGYSELVADELSESEQAHLGDDLAKIGGAAKHLLALIGDILDLTQIEAGTRAIARTSVDLREVVDEVIVLVEPAIREGSNELRVDVPARLRVRGDRFALARVLVHLLDNAAKFTAGGVVELRARGEGDAVVIAVRDTGVGVPAQAQEGIFDRFTQADDSATRLYGGVGLGLAICKELVTRMGGTIALESAPGEGSTFSVRLAAI
ncbi:MAG: HAMP domain-containing sensor histidine kinase [Nannocystaceae bacterium]